MSPCFFTVAWRAGRRADNAAFFTGGRRIRWYWVALAMIGAPMSGVTFVSVPGSVAADGFTYMQMVAGFTIGQLIVAYVLVPTFYRLKVVSLYEYLDRRFGIRTHRTGAAFFLLSKTVLSALKLYVVCIVLQQLVCTPLGIPFAANAVLTVLFVWGYTRRGGVRSVVWTDVLQTLCLLAALVSALVAIPGRSTPRCRPCWAMSCGVPTPASSSSTILSPSVRSARCSSPASSFWWR